MHIVSFDLRCPSSSTRVFVEQELIKNIADAILIKMFRKKIHIGQVASSAFLIYIQTVHKQRFWVRVLFAIKHDIVILQYVAVSTGKISQDIDVWSLGCFLNFWHVILTNLCLTLIKMGFFKKDLENFNCLFLKKVWSDDFFLN